MGKISDKDRLKLIGNKLENLRIKNGYTSYERFAIEQDLNRRFYWEVEKGRNISLLYLFKILDMHEISIEDFFKDIP